MAEGNIGRADSAAEALHTTAENFIREMDKILAERIRDLDMEGDPEKAHWEADKILCAILDFSGFDLSARAFRSITKYYA